MNMNAVNVINEHHASQTKQSFNKTKINLE